MTTEMTTSAEFSAHLELQFKNLLVPRVKAFFDHDKDRAAAFVRACHVAFMQSERSKDLAECPMETIIDSCIECADAGLSLTKSLGHAALIPYGGVCTLSVMYRGLIQMAVADGKNVKRIEAYVVREGDGFRFHRGTSPSIEHKPHLEALDGPIVAAYAIAIFDDGSQMFEVMSVEQMNARHRAKSKTYQKNSGPWITDEESMYRKCVVRILCKWLDLQPRTAKYLERDQQIELGKAIDVQSEIANAPPKADLADAIVVPGAPVVVDVDTPYDAALPRVADSAPLVDADFEIKDDIVVIKLADPLSADLMVSTIAALINQVLKFDVLAEYMDKTHGLPLASFDNPLDDLAELLDITFRGSPEALTATYTWVCETYQTKVPK